MRKYRNKLNIFLKKNTRIISPLFFGSGFLLDSLTLTRIDQFYDNMVLLTHLFIVMFTIVVMNYGDCKDIKNKFLLKFYFWSFFILQFSFGALLSGYIIFYTRSASFWTSWPFLILFYLSFIGNERFRKYNEKIEVQMSILFLAVFSFSVFWVPIILKEVGDIYFLISGILSLAFISSFIFIIFKILPNLKKFKVKIFRNILIIYFIFNGLYFLNLIPPIPLSMKSMEVVHDTGRNSEGKYFVVREKKGFTELTRFWRNDFYKKEGKKVYFYNAIFAPTGLETQIRHVWSRYDEMGGEWKRVGVMKHKIIGGRGGGYRWYSYITNPEEGEWRIDVLNNSDLVIGRYDFVIKSGGGDLELEMEVLGE